MGKSSFSLLSSDMKRLQNRFGFALPTVMMVSLIMITLLAAALQFVSSSQSALSRQYYLQLAREAGESGLVYASKCISQNNGAISWTDAKPLKPDTDCSGNTVSGADGYVFKSGLIQTIFTIGFPKTSSDGKAHTINSVGVAQLLRKSDNQVSREYSQTVQAYAGSSAVSTVMSSSDFACSLVEPSQVYCWGKNVFDVLGENVSPTATNPSRIDISSAFEGKTITKLARGSYGATHMCVIANGSTDGEVYCWGNNTYGQLGDGTGNGSLKTSPIPVKVGGLLAGKKVTDVAIGGGGSCAIASDGVYCWGSNSDGQLGNNSSSTAYSNVPVKVSGISTATKISYGDRHVCAISSGKVYCWGWGNWGQLGQGATGTSANKYVATVVNGLLSGKTATDVSANHATTCAVAKGEAYCWGDSGSGVLGVGSGVASTNYPMKVLNTTGKPLYGKTVTQVSGGYKHNCALTSDGKVYCWGGNVGVGVVGNNSLNTNEYEPVEAQMPSGSGKVTSISASAYRTCAIMSGDTYCWGRVYDGQSRLGVQTPQLINSGFIEDKDISKVATGGGSVCVIVGTRVSCWGQNNYGQLGNDTTDNSSIPVGVNGFTGTLSNISSSGGTTCTTLGSNFYCWGQNIAGKVGNNSIGSTSHYQKVYKDSGGALYGTTAQMVNISGYVSCGIASGQAYCWGGYASAVDVSSLGNNKTLQSGSVTYYAKTPVEVYRETNVLSGKTVTAMSDGGTCVVASSKIYCWGENDIGQLGLGTYTAGSSKPVAVLAQSGVLLNKTPTVMATGSTGYTCAATTEPNIYCWGYNFDGQYGNDTRTTSNKPLLITVTGHPLKGKTITKLTAGSSHTCALTSDGEMYCWGYNSLGQIGDGTNITRTLPVKVQGVLSGKVITDISARESSTCAVADARVYCWGSNDYGQMGNGTSQTEGVPVPTKALSIPPFVLY